MRKNLTLPALMVVLLATPAAADHLYVDTDLLFGWCKPYEVGDIGPGPLCAGYIYAVADIIASGESIHQRQACVPHEVSLDDLRNLVVGEMDKRPRVSPVSAHAWVAEVMANAYPCVPAKGQ